MRGNLSLVNVEGTRQILSHVNGLRAEAGEEPLFDVHLVGLDRKTSQFSGLSSVSPDSLLSEVPTTDLIVIPAVHDDQVAVIEANRAFIPWIVDQHRKGAEVASLCIGAFFLAATGLIDGRSCSTHPSEASLFRRMYPAVRLVDEKIVTEEDGIYSSGGAYSFLNLLLHIVEKHAGREITVTIAKVFMIDPGRESQSPFTIFRGQRDHDDEAVRGVQDFIEAHWTQRLTVEQLADRAALGRRSLERRFLKATYNTVAAYVQRVKVEAAKKRLELGQRTVFEVMSEVGYSDIKAFRTVFKKYTGMTPVDYRNRYNRAATARERTAAPIDCHPALSGLAPLAAAPPPGMARLPPKIGVPTPCPQAALMVGF